MHCLPHYMSLLNLVSICVILFYVFYEIDSTCNEICILKQSVSFAHPRCLNQLQETHTLSRRTGIAVILATKFLTCSVHCLCKLRIGPKFPSLKCFLHTDTYLSLAPSTICSPSFTATPSSL